jgi:hypothetical protein
MAHHHTGKTKLQRAFDICTNAFHPVTFAPVFQWITGADLFTDLCNTFPVMLSADGVPYIQPPPHPATLKMDSLAQHTGAHYNYKPTPWLRAGT